MPNPDPTRSFEDRIRQAIADPRSVVGNRLSPSWGVGKPGYAAEEETVVDWSTRAVLAVLAEADADAQREQDEHVAQVIADTGLQGMDVVDGEVRLRIVLAYTLATKMCLAFRDILDAAGPDAVNYVEQTVTDRETGERYTFIVVKPGGKTPNQLRRQAEQERDELRAAMTPLNPDQARGTEPGA